MKHGIYVAVCSLFSVLAPHRYINPHKAPAYWQESEKSQKHTARLKTGQQRQATECKGRKSSSQKNKEIQEFNFSKTWPGTTQVQWEMTCFKAKCTALQKWQLLLLATCRGKMKNRLSCSWLMEGHLQPNMPAASLQLLIPSSMSF